MRESEGARLDSLRQANRSLVPSREADWQQDGKFKESEKHRARDTRVQTGGVNFVCPAFHCKATLVLSLVTIEHSMINSFAHGRKYPATKSLPRGLMAN